MTREEMKEFNEFQCHEMAVHKWIESEKAGHDLGVAAEKDWVDKYAKPTREHWEASKKAGILGNLPR